MVWHFHKIPPEKSSLVLSLNEEGKYNELAILLINLGVVPGGCDGCGIPSLVPGFMEHAIDQNLIPINYENQGNNK